MPLKSYTKSMSHLPLIAKGLRLWGREIACAPLPRNGLLLAMVLGSFVLGVGYLLWGIYVASVPFQSPPFHPFLWRAVTALVVVWSVYSMYTLLEHVLFHIDALSRAHTHSGPSQEHRSAFGMVALPYALCAGAGCLFVCLSMLTGMFHAPALICAGVVSVVCTAVVRALGGAVAYSRPIRRVCAWAWQRLQALGTSAALASHKDTLAKVWLRLSVIGNLTLLCLVWFAAAVLYKSEDGVTAVALVQGAEWPRMLVLLSIPCGLYLLLLWNGLLSQPSIATSAHLPVSRWERWFWCLQPFGLLVAVLLGMGTWGWGMPLALFGVAVLMLSAAVFSVLWIVHGLWRGTRRATGALYDKGFAALSAHQKLAIMKEVSHRHRP